MLISQGLQIYVNDPKSGISKQGSQKGYKSTIGRLGRNREINTVTEQEILDACFTVCVSGMRKGQPPASSTLRTRRVRFKGFFDYAEYAGWVKTNPAKHLNRHIRGSIRPVKQNNWLTREQVNEVLASVDVDTPVGAKDNICLRLGFTAGLRKSELANLRWKDVNFDHKEINLIGKGDKIATVSISANTFGYLADWHAQCAVDLGRKPHDECLIPAIDQQGVYDPSTGSWNGTRATATRWSKDPVSPTTIASVCARASQRAGINFAPHDMRRTFAGLLFEKVDIYQLKNAMRHSDVGVTERYLQTRPDSAAQAVREAGLDF